MSFLTVNLSTGSSTEGESGSVYIKVGSSASGPGGDLQLEAGSSSNEDELGGSTLIQAGAGVGGGGTVHVSGGVVLSSDVDNAKAEARCMSVEARLLLAMVEQWLSQLAQAKREAVIRLFRLAFLWILVAGDC